MFKRAFFRAVLGLVVASRWIAPVAAQTAASPAPAASAAPAASPTPRPLGLHVAGSASATYVGQGTSGPGQIGPEAPGFIGGSPLSPNTPYDLFNSAPQVPGNVGIGQLTAAFTFGTKAFDIGVTTGIGYVRGSITNAAYWGENLMPALNPHLGSQALPYAIAFPTRAGSDDGTGVRLSVLSATLASADGNLRLRGGWFDLAQTDRFVFAQPALTNANPAIAYAPAETLGNGVAGSDTWQPFATALPLHGIDLVAKRGLATLELSNAALPSLPGEAARLHMGSFVIDHGEGTRYSVQVLHASTSGLAFATTVPFGSNPTFVPTPQGVLPTSILDGQRQTIVGVRAAVHLAPAIGLDGIVELGRAWYDASPVANPGTSAPGGFEHIGFSRTAGRATASLDIYRMGPRYATIILPYGVPENQWSVAFAWPGQWLKSNYQLIDNSVLGVNRQGYRLRYALDKGALEIHTEYTDLHQIEAETTQTATQSGYIDGYYLPQLPAFATFGRQKRYGFWAAWHPRFGDVTLDVIDDTLYRPFAPAHPEDRVSYEVPQAVLAFSRHLSPAVTAATGIGRYAMNGTFSEPLDFAERLFFLGAQIRQSPNASLSISFRRTAFSGLPTLPGASSPNVTGSAVILEQRLTFAR